MPEAEPQGPAEPQSYAGPERRIHDRRHREPPRVIGLARMRAGSYPSLSRDTWYAVVDRNPEATPAEALGGYVWLDVDGRLRHIWREHLEIRDDHDLE